MVGHDYFHSSIKDHLDPIPDFIGPKQRLGTGVVCDVSNCPRRKAAAKTSPLFANANNAVKFA
jgi:hypothetical protein